MRNRKNRMIFVAVMMIFALVLASCGAKQASQASVGAIAEKETQAAVSEESEAEAESEAAGEAEEAPSQEAAELAAAAEAITEAEEAAGAEEAEVRDGSIASEDGGLSTKYPAEYKAEWLHESDVLGGIRIYTGEAGEIPFASVSRILHEEDYETEDPVELLYDGLMEETAFEAEFFGLIPYDAEEVQEYTIGGKTLTGTNIYFEDEDGAVYKMLLLILPTYDEQDGDSHFLRFLALYDESRDEDREALMSVLEMTVSDVRYDHIYDVVAEVQPGNLLLDFCNDPALRVWFERTEKMLPDELTYTSDRWHTITDPETIRAALDALKTVKIGDVSDEHVGASGRQIFDFYYRDGGSGPDLVFFENTFKWGDENYEVLDWGDLADTDLIGAAEN